jgi:hypothetical protein
VCFSSRVRRRVALFQLMIVVASSGLGIWAARAYVAQVLDRRRAVVERIPAGALGPDHLNTSWSIRVWLADPFNFAAVEGSSRCVLALLALGLVVARAPDLIESLDHLGRPGTAASFTYAIIIAYQIAGFAASLALGPGVDVGALPKKWTELVGCLGPELGGAILAVWANLFLLRRTRGPADWIECLGLAVGTSSVLQIMSAAMFKAIRLSLD